MEYKDKIKIPSLTLLVFPNKFILYRLLLIMEIGFILPKIGIFLSNITLIWGPIIPDKNDKIKVVAMAIKVFTLWLLLLEAPINIPRAVPNTLPNITKILLYLISLNNCIFKAYLIKINNTPLANKFSVNATMNPAIKKLFFFN